MLKRNLTILPTSIPYQSTLVRSLETYIGILYNTVPLQYVKWEIQLDGSYLYQIKLLDGRLWKQTVKIIPGDSLQTFNVTNEWKQSEFVLQRPIRDLLLQLTSESALTSIILTFTES